MSRLEDCTAAALGAVASFKEYASFAGGSVFAGLGTPTSDADVFIVVDTENFSEQLFVEGVRVDVEFLNLQFLRTAIDDLKAAVEPGADLSDRVHQYGRRKLDVLIRFHDGIVLNDPVGELGMLHREIHEMHSALSTCIVGQELIDAANQIEDSIGFAAVSEAGAELFATRMACLLAGKAWLARRGDIYPGVKWVWSQAGRSGVGSLISNLTIAGKTRDIDYLHFLRQDLSVGALGGYEYDFFADLEPGSLSRVPEDSALLGGAAVGLLRADGTGIALSHQGLSLWGFSHGRRRRDVPWEFSKKYGIEQSRVSKYLDSLLDAGILRENMKL